VVKIGYTHYWDIRKKPRLKDLSGCLENIKKVILQYQDVIQLEDDDGKPPLITKNLIAFNGIGEDGHETFYFEFPPSIKKIKDSVRYELTPDDKDFTFNFCKTARKPYDECVARCLLILKEYLKDDMKLNSDGDFKNEEEWGRAIKEVQSMGIDVLPHLIVEEL